MGTSALANPYTARSSASAHPGTVVYARAGPDGSCKTSRLGESEPCFCRDARQPPCARWEKPGQITGTGNLIWLESSRRVLQQLRPLSAAPGSSALNRPGPARESKSQARVHQVYSGPGPPAQNNMLQSGFYAPPSQGAARQSGSSTPHRVGLQHLRSLTAAPGSTVLNRPAPLGSSGY